MKKLLLSSVALLGVTVGAGAADLPRRAAHGRLPSWSRSRPFGRASQEHAEAHRAWPRSPSVPMPLTSCEEPAPATPNPSRAGVRVKASFATISTIRNIHVATLKPWPAARRCEFIVGSGSRWQFTYIRNSSSGAWRF